MSGQKFGRLTVIGLDKERMKQNKIRIQNGEIKSYKTYFLCECECGNIKSIDSSALKSGTVVSCGCYQKELSKTIIPDKNRKHNNYRIENNCVYMKSSTNNNDEFIIDIDDFDKVYNYCWHIDDNGYVIAPIPKKKNKYYRLHRFVLNYDEEGIVDHINHNTRDNRKENLRITNDYGNNVNSLRKLSGIVKDKNKWNASIQYNLRKINLGYYDDINEAIDIRLKAEQVFFGEYSYLNSIYKEMRLYMDNTIKINLKGDKEKLVKLVKMANNFISDVDLIYGRYILDCKTIDDVNKIDLTKNLEVRIISDNTTECRNFDAAMEEFR